MAHKASPTHAMGSNSNSNSSGNSSSSSSSASGNSSSADANDSSSSRSGQLITPSTSSDSSKRSNVNDSNSSIENKCRLFIGNLHPSTSEGDLIHIFSAFGKLNNVEYVWHKSGPEKGRPKGFAFLEYNDEKSARRAVDAGGASGGSGVKKAGGICARARRLQVRYCHNNSKGSDTSIFTESSVNDSKGGRDGKDKGKRGRDEGVGEGEGDQQKSRNIRQIDEKMRRLEETLRRMEKG